MRKLDFPTLIKEDFETLEKRERQETTARLRLRVQFLRLLKTQSAMSIKAVCQTIGITAKRGYEWWDLYKEKELDGYLRLHYKPRRVRLSPEQQAQLQRASERGKRIRLAARSDQVFAGRVCDCLYAAGRLFIVSAIENQSQRAASRKQKGGQRSANRI